MQVPPETGRGHQIPWSWNYRESWAAVREYWESVSGPLSTRGLFPALPNGFLHIFIFGIVAVRCIHSQGEGNGLEGKHDRS